MNMQAGHSVLFYPVLAARCECDESKKSFTLFKMVREGFTCGWLAMIHSSRVRTELFLAAAAAAPPPGVSSSPRRSPPSSKNNCSSTSATPTPSSPPPATQIFRPWPRCELANETARGRTSCTKTCCCARLFKGRCMRSTRDLVPPPLSPSAAAPGRVPSLLSWECGSFGRGLSVSTGGVATAMMMNAVSPSSLSGSHVPGTPARSSRGRSAGVQSSTRPPTFSTGVGSALHAPCISSSLPCVCSVSRAAATSLTTTASSSSREHSSNSARCFQNRCGVRPCNVVVGRPSSFHHHHLCHQVIAEEKDDSERTWPHNSWSSPDPCTYENPPMRRSVPASIARDALTHITGRKGASGATYGKRADAGVIHSGRNGLASSGSAYDESCGGGSRDGGVKGRGLRWEGRTARAAAQLSSRAAIWACS
jgi:hypothetical protein